MKAADIKFASVCAIAGTAVAFAAFAVNFWVVQGPFPGYKILTYPGIVTAGIFSEEINFWPKLSIMLIGQFLFYFVSALVVRIIHKVAFSNASPSQGQ